MPAGCNIPPHWANKRQIGVVESNQRRYYGREAHAWSGTAGAALAVMVQSSPAARDRRHLVGWQVNT